MTQTPLKGEITEIFNDANRKYQKILKIIYDENILLRFF